MVLTWIEHELEALKVKYEELEEQRVRLEGEVREIETRIELLKERYTERIRELENKLEKLRKLVEGREIGLRRIESEFSKLNSASKP